METGNLPGISYLNQKVIEPKLLAFQESSIAVDWYDSHSRQNIGDPLHCFKLDARSSAPEWHNHPGYFKVVFIGPFHECTWPEMAMDVSNLKKRIRSDTPQVLWAVSATFFEQGENEFIPGSVLSPLFTLHNTEGGIVLPAMYCNRHAYIMECETANKKVRRRVAQVA